MREKHEQLFKRLPVLEPSNMLARNILLRIQKHQQIVARIKIVCTIVIMFGSLVTLIPAIRYITQEFSRSGFYEYISIIFYDSGVLVSYWKEIFLSLMDSIPYFGITVFLLSLFVLLWSFGNIIRNIKKTMSRTYLLN